MPESLHIVLNGQTRSVDGLAAPVSLDRLVQALELQSDRIAVECNGTIAPRASWPQTSVNDGDKLEIVHFVGGGLDESGTGAYQLRSSRTCQQPVDPSVVRVNSIPILKRRDRCSTGDRETLPQLR